MSLQPYSFGNTPDRICCNCLNYVIVPLMSMINFGVVFDVVTYIIDVTTDIDFVTVINVVTDIYCR